jgi:hypothetical protein
MPAILTDKFRIQGASRFISDVSDSSNSYYLFIGLPNHNEIQSNWNNNPPAPKDSFDDENSYHESMISLKKISSSDVVRVIRKVTWSQGTTYEQYRHNYTRTNLSPVSSATNLYDSNFYVVNSQYRVYVCIQNGTDPDNLTGRPSLGEPLHTDLEPRVAGSSGDGYLWKYLFTINPNSILKFDNDFYIPLPNDWYTNSIYSNVRDNAVDGQIKVINLYTRGNTYNLQSQVATVNIKGDGSGGTASVTFNANKEIESIVVSNGGSGYTYATLDFESAGIVANVPATYEVIIPPKGGHGKDIYSELGSYRVLVYARIENNSTDPDFVTDNTFARVGLIKNPVSFGSTSIASNSNLSAVYALKLTGAGASTATFTQNSQITQTVGVGTTAVGKVVSYDQTTGVLKYWQERSLYISTTTSAPKYGRSVIGFTTSISTGGNLNIVGGSVTLQIDTSFGTQSNPGVTTTINSRKYYLGQSFVSGLSNPEIKKYSGDIVYVDNRASILRSVNQKEDFKIVLEF